jgi:hypothetical protein
MNIRVMISLVLVVAFAVALTALPSREDGLPFPAVLSLEHTAHLKGGVHEAADAVGHDTACKQSQRGLLRSGQDTNGVVQLPVLG